MTILKTEERVMTMRMGRGNWKKDSGYILVVTAWLGLMSDFQ